MLTKHDIGSFFFYNKELLINNYKVEKSDTNTAICFQYTILQSQTGDVRGILMTVIKRNAIHHNTVITAKCM